MKFDNLRNFIKRIFEISEKIRNLEMEKPGNGWRGESKKNLEKKSGELSRASNTKSFHAGCERR